MFKRKDTQAELKRLTAEVLSAAPVGCSDCFLTLQEARKLAYSVFAGWDGVTIEEAKVAFHEEINNKCLQGLGIIATSPDRLVMCGYNGREFTESELSAFDELLKDEE